MARRTIWQLPRLHEEGEHEERRVTWLELFYDLVFVVVIAQLSHHLAEHIDGGGVLGFALLFALIWWVWLGGTIYNERFETQNDLSSRVLTFTQMLPVAAMALFIGDGIGAASAQFALAYAAARVVIIGLWLYGGWHDRRFWPVASRYVIGFSCSVALILLSLAVPPPWRFGLWAASLVSDLAIPLSTRALQARLPRFSTSKLPERFGLFVIIVLGEGIVSVVNGVADRPAFSPLAALDGALGIALAFGLWWIYFDFVWRRRTRPARVLAWAYLHIPLLGAIAAVAAGVLNVVGSETNALPGAVRWLIAGALAVALVAVALLELTKEHDEREPTHRLGSPALKVGAAAAALAVAALGGGLGPAAVLLVLLGLLLLPMAYGAYVWFAQQVSDEAPVPTAEPEPSIGEA